MKSEVGPVWEYGGRSRAFRSRCHCVPSPVAIRYSIQRTPTEVLLTRLVLFAPVDTSIPLSFGESAIPRPKESSGINDQHHDGELCQTGQRQWAPKALSAFKKVLSEASGEERGQEDQHRWVGKESPGRDGSRLLVPDLDVPPREGVEQLPELPQLAEVQRLPSLPGLDQRQPAFLRASQFVSNAFIGPCSRRRPPENV